MSLPYDVLTPILGGSSTEYEPEYETSCDFMNGKFNELLENDKYLNNQINVLYNASYGSTLKTLDNIDLNDFELDGEFWVNGYTCQNVPVINYWGKLKNKVLDGANIFQTFFNHVNGAGVFFRVKNNNEWFEWEHIATYKESIMYKGIIGIETDWNTIKQCGTYAVHAGKGENSPFKTYTSEYDYGQLIVTTALHTITQEYTSHSTCITIKRSGWVDGDGSIRWTGWKRLATQDEIQAIQEQLNATQEMLVSMMKMEG